MSERKVNLEEILFTEVDKMREDFPRKQSILNTINQVK